MKTTKKSVAKPAVKNKSVGVTSAAKAVVKKTAVKPAKAKK